MISVKLEVNVKNNVFLHDIRNSKEKNMKEQKMNLKQLANYLIQLFYKTGRRYTCTQTKIGKLLTILAFIYARKNQILFEEIIYKYDGCGTVISELKLFVSDRDVYIQSTYEDGDHLIEEPIEDELFSVQDESLNKYRDVSNISDELKNEIEDVFRNFGALSSYSIGQLINTVIDYDNVTGANGVVNLERIAELHREEFENSNRLLDYLFSN